MSTLNPEAVEAALRAIISDIDYDIHKSIESDEETGEDTYPDVVGDFIEKYDETPPTGPSDFERGVLAGIQALENYFRDENDNLMIAEAREDPDHENGWDWVRLTREDFDGYRKGAIADAAHEARA